MELGAYGKDIKETDMVNIMRFSKDKLGLLDKITVYSDRYYPYAKVSVDNKEDKSRASMQVYLKEKKLNHDNYNTPEGNAIHINHMNGIICDNVNENLEELERSENLADRHIFTKKTQFEIRTEEAMFQMIGILNSETELTNCNGVLIKKNSKDYRRNPGMCLDEDVITVSDFFQNWKKLHPRKSLSKTYQIK